MRVKVEIGSVGETSCVLTDVDRFSDFKVVVDPRLSPEAAGDAMATAGVGELLGGNAWVSIPWLKSQLAGQGATFWIGFDGMVSYAKSHGWLSSDQTALQAHVEHQDLSRPRSESDAIPLAVQ